MTPAQARALAAALFSAADKADAEGESTISVLQELRALDDAARADLDAAIKAAAGSVDN